MPRRKSTKKSRSRSKARSKTRRKSTKKSRSRSKARSKTRRTKIIKGGKIDYAIDCFPGETDCEKNILEEEEHAALQQEYDDGGIISIFTRKQGNSEILERQRRRNDIRTTNMTNITNKINKENEEQEQILDEHELTKQILAKKEHELERLKAKIEKKREKEKKDREEIKNAEIAGNQQIIYWMIKKYEEYLINHSALTNDNSFKNIFDNVNDIEKLQSLKDDIDTLNKTCESLIKEAYEKSSEMIRSRIINDMDSIDYEMQMNSVLRKNKEFYKNSLLLITMAITSYNKKVSVDDPNVFADALDLKKPGFVGKECNEKLRKTTCEALINSKNKFFIPDNFSYEIDGKIDTILSKPLVDTNLLKVMTTPYQCEPEYEKLREKINSNQRDICIPKNKEDYKKSNYKYSKECLDEMTKNGLMLRNRSLFQ